MRNWLFENTRLTNTLEYVGHLVQDSQLLANAFCNVIFLKLSFCSRGCHQCVLPGRSIRMCSPTPNLPICVGHLQCNLSAAAAQCVGVCWCVCLLVHCNVPVCFGVCQYVCQCTTVCQFASVPVSAGVFAICCSSRHLQTCCCCSCLHPSLPAGICCHYFSFLFSLPSNHYK